MCTAENSIFPPVADLNESGDALLVLDQTLLPWEEKLLSLKHRRKSMPQFISLRCAALRLSE
jgi:aromatic ring hydroxylase